MLLCLIASIPAYPFGGTHRTKSGTHTTFQRTGGALVKVGTSSRYCKDRRESLGVERQCHVIECTHTTRRLLCVISLSLIFPSCPASFRTHWHVGWHTRWNVSLYDEDDDGRHESTSFQCLVLRPVRPYPLLGCLSNRHPTRQLAGLVHARYLGASHCAESIGSFSGGHTRNKAIGASSKRKLCLTGEVRLAFCAFFASFICDLESSKMGPLPRATPRGVSLNYFGHIVEKMCPASSGIKFPWPPASVQNQFLAKLPLPFSS